MLACSVLAALLAPQTAAVRTAAGQTLPADAATPSALTPDAVTPDAAAPEALAPDVAAPGSPATPTLNLSPAAQDLKGRRIDNVFIRGNAEVSSGVIRNLIRSRVGEPYDPVTVTEDYQRIFGLRKFANVEAKVEPTLTGVNVVFIVTEQRQVQSIVFKGASRIDADTLRKSIDLREGEAIDTFRISLARAAIEAAYKDKNYPLAHVSVDEEALAQKGAVVFNVVEGPQVRVRNISFVGADSFTSDRLLDQIESSTFIFIFRSGKYSPEQVEDDVAALRRYYEGKGFFDVRVGRRLLWSPDLTELEIQFLIEEGPRYTIDKVTFQRVAGDTVAPAEALGVGEQELRQKMKMLEGRPFDEDFLRRDVREIVRVYSSRFGYIYYPGSTDPDYLRVETKRIFRSEPGKVELVYQIHEGKEFRVGNIYVKGNYKSQDKLVLREFRDLTPGSKFNSADLQDAAERLRRLPYFSSVVVTPIGEEPGVCDLLVQIDERRTASFNIGAGVNSNGGIGGNITYEQQNFDIGNWPAGFNDIFSERAFTGAGQNFRASFEPGTRFTSAYLRFSEPYLFDQPFGFANDLYLRNRIREEYDDQRIGDTVTFSHRFNYQLSGAVSFRGEQVKIHNIDDRRFRAQEIIDGEGTSGLTSTALTLKYDTTDPGLFPSSGTVTTGRWESYGVLGGDHDFNKFNLEFSAYQTLFEDLLERKTVLAFRGNAGYISGSSPFFERFYGGGLGSVRGFEFRGISPRSGPEDDPIGGDFTLTGTVEVNFPVSGDSLRGVVFSDFGTVESDVRLGTIRTSVGAGVRVFLPILGQAPLAVDFAFPLVKDDQDDTQLISFSFGFLN